MRIAIVSGFFIDGRGYQENLWAEELARQGHNVSVFTTAHLPCGQQHDQDASSAEIMTVHRLPARQLPSAILLSGRAGELLAKLRPDLVLWFGVGQFFGRCLLSDARLRAVPVVSFFGENLGMHEFDWRKPGIPAKQRLRALAFRLVRGRLYRQVFDRSQLVVATKRQTVDILLDLCPNEPARARLRQRMIDLPLGFCPRAFRFVPAVRGQMRQELAVAQGELLIVGSSRFTAGKRLEVMVDGMLEALRRNPRMVACLVGFVEGDATSRAILNRIESSPLADRFRCEPFASRGRLAALFNAADVGVYNSPSISVQEAMGTGLYMVLAGDGSMAHLLRSPEHGLFFNRESPQDAADALQKAEQIVAARRHDYTAWRESLRNAHAWLGYDRLAEDLLARLSAPSQQADLSRRTGDGVCA